jgi:large subunit ribosomal protein L18
MNRLAHIKQSSSMRAKRVRSKLHGTEQRPRLSVNISNSHISAQLINDDNSTTIVYVSSVGKKLNGSMSDKAAAIGKEMAKKAKQAKVDKIIFDRGPKLYHGRVKALADAAREEGLEF